MRFASLTSWFSSVYSQKSHGCAQKLAAIVCLACTIALLIVIRQPIQLESFVKQTYENFLIALLLKRSKDGMKYVTERERKFYLKK